MLPYAGGCPLCHPAKSLQIPGIVRPASEAPPGQSLECSESATNACPHMRALLRPAFNHYSSWSRRSQARGIVSTDQIQSLLAGERKTQRKENSKQEIETGK